MPARRPAKSVRTAILQLLPATRSTNVRCNGATQPHGCYRFVAGGIVGSGPVVTIASQVLGTRA